MPLSGAKRFFKRGGVAPYHRRDPRAYREAQRLILDGDWLLWRPTSLLGRSICWGTRAPYSHAAMAGWWEDSLLAVEMIQWHGGRVAMLSEQVRRWPGACDVYRPRYPYDRMGALSQMIRLVSQDYGWLDFGRMAALAFLPRVVLPARKDTDQLKIQPVCSAGLAWASRTGGGVKACPGRADLDTTPGHLAFSGVANYQFTLYPET